MANEVTVTTGDVRAVKNVMSIKAYATEALAFGDVVYVDSAVGILPHISKADASAVDALLVAVGIVVSGSVDNPGATSVAVGDVVDVILIGTVTGYSSMTPGATIWLSDTVGRLSTVVGTKSTVIGVALTAETLFVNPGYYTRAS